MKKLIRTTDQAFLFDGLPAKKSMRLLPWERKPAFQLARKGLLMYLEDGSVQLTDLGRSYRRAWRKAFKA